MTHRRITQGANHGARTAVLIGTALFLAGIAACMVLVHPGRQVQVVGLSVYGTRLRSILPYTLALLGIAVAFAWAAEVLARQDGRQRTVVGTLRACAALAVGVLATPYDLDRYVNWTHVAFATTLFAVQVLLAGWLVLLTGSVALRILFAGQLAGDAVCLAALAGLARPMLIGQLITQLAFLGLLGLAVGRLEPGARSAVPAGPRR